MPTATFSQGMVCAAIRRQFANSSRKVEYIDTAAIGPVAMAITASNPWRILQAKAREKEQCYCTAATSTTAW